MAFPHLGCGLYGYEAHAAGTILLEELVESLLQIDEVQPKYKVCSIHLINIKIQALPEPFSWQPAWIEEL